MNTWLIVEVNEQGEKTASKFFDFFETPDAAYAMQEILEILHPDYSYLVYSADEWMQEVENGGHLPT